jgi:DNA-binding transcriptional ArsR family regulator
MKDGPHIAKIASLVGDRARADILTALMGGQALTATELAQVAGITKQTVSAHLAKLAGAKLVAVQSQGRHRYFALADRDVAHLLESLMGVAYRTGAVRLRSSPREPALRLARVCYDHLAGELGVMACEALEQRRHLRRDGTGVRLTAAGAVFLRDFGIDTRTPGPSRRPPCRLCLDWSVRRHHLAGALGAAMLQRLYDLGWARREPGSRVVAFTSAGEREFRKRFAT